MARPSVSSASTRSVSCVWRSGVAAALHPDVLVDVELAGRQPARINGVERRVAAVGGVEDVLHLLLDVELPGKLCAIFDDAVLPR